MFAILGFGRPSHAIVVVVLGFLALAVAYSVRSILGLAMPIWEKELAWSRSDVSNIAAAALVIMAIVAPLSGLDRKGLRITLLVGLVAVCTSSALVSVSDSTFTLLLGFGLVGGFGFGIVSTHIVAAAVARLFPIHVGFASGIATAGSSAGQFIIVPMVALVLVSFSWRLGFAVLGIGTALLIPFIWLIPNDKTETTSDNDAVKVGEMEGQFWFVELKKLFLSPIFHLLFWSYLICGYTTTGVIETHLLPYAHMCGFAPIPSATAFGLLSAVNLVGMIGVGWLTDRVNRPLLLGGIYIVRGLTFWLLLNIGSSYESLLLFAIIFGLVDYSTVPVTTSLVSSHLGLKTVGFVSGLLTVGHQLGAALGASIGGYMFDRHTSYDLVWGSSIVLAMFAGLLALLLSEKTTNVC